MRNIKNRQSIKPEDLEKKIFYVSMRVADVTAEATVRMQREVPSEIRLCQLCSKEVWVSKKSLDAGIARVDDDSMIIACGRCTEVMVEKFGDPEHITASVDGKIVSVEDGEEVTEDMRKRIMGQQ